MIHAPNDHQVQDVHAIVIDLVDKHMTKVYNHMNDQSQSLKSCESERKQAYTQLASAWREVDRVNKIVLTLTEQLRTHVCTPPKVPNADDAEKSHQEQKRRLDSTQASLVDAHAQIDQLAKINTAYAANIRVHTQVNRTLISDQQIAEQVTNLLKLEIARTNQKLDTVVAQNRNLSKKLAEQQNETHIAQNAIRRMSDEIVKATQIRHALEKQWEEAMASMTKRDTTLSALDQSKTEIQNELIAAQSVIRSQEQECQRFNTECTKYMQEISDLRISLDEANTKWHDTNSQFQSQLVENQKHRDLFDNSSKQVTDEHRMRVKAEEQVLKLKNEMQRMQTEFATLNLNKQTELAHSATLISQQNKNFHEQAINHANHLTHAQTERVHIQHENAELDGMNQTLRQQLAAARSEIQTNESKYKKAIGEVDHLSNELQQITFKLEKKDLELGHLQADRVQYTDTRSLELTVTSLTNELNILKSDQVNAQSEWMKLQDRNCRLEQANKQLKAEIQACKTNSSVYQNGNVKTLDSLKESQRHCFETNMQMSEMHIELQKLRAKVIELEECNAIQESQMVHSTIRMDEMNANTQSAVHILKHDIRRVSKEKSVMSRVKISDERVISVLNQKLQLSNEMLAQVQTEKHLLQRKNATLRIKNTQWAAKVSDMHLQWKRLSDVRTHKRLGASKIVPPLAANDADVPALKLRNETLSLENKHLSEEIQINNSRINELESSQMKLNTVLSQMQLQQHKLEIQQETHIGMLNTAIDRAVRAENVAAFLENHVKQVRPNTRVEYLSVLNTQFDPSPSLQAVFLKPRIVISGDEGLDPSLSASHQNDDRKSPEKSGQKKLPKLVSTPSKDSVSGPNVLKQSFGHFAASQLASTPRKLVGL